MPTRCNRWFFIANLIIRSTCFGHHYAHHQELKNIIQVVAACGTWFFGLQVVGLVWSCRLCVRFQTGHITKEPSTIGSNHLYNILELLMMGIVVPETCWANNKVCNKEPSVSSSWPFYHHILRSVSISIIFYLFCCNISLLLYSLLAYGFIWLSKWNIGPVDGGL